MYFAGVVVGAFDDAGRIVKIGDMRACGSLAKRTRTTYTQHTTIEQQDKL